MGKSGCILVTTRNPECTIQLTVSSCQLGGMERDEGVTLLLKATGAEDAANEAAQKKTISVAQILGFLVLAIVQASSY